MNIVQLSRVKRLLIVFSSAFIVNFLGLVVFVLHCDSPNSWVCVFEYIGLPGLLVGFVVPFPEEVGAAYAGIVLVSIPVLSFLIWSWIVASTLTWRLRRSNTRLAKSLAV